MPDACLWDGCVVMEAERKWCVKDFTGTRYCKHCTLYSKITVVFTICVSERVFSFGLPVKFNDGSGAVCVNLCLLCVGVATTAAR
jgi:hypothetical protein